MIKIDLPNDLNEKFFSYKFTNEESLNSNLVEIRDFLLTKLIHRLSTNFYFLAFQIGQLESISELRSKKTIHVHRNDPSVNQYIKEYVIGGLNKSFFVRLINFIGKSSSLYPNKCFIIEKHLINKFDNEILDIISEYLIINGLGNVNSNEIAKILGCKIGISQYIDSPSIGVWQINYNANEILPIILSVLDDKY
ncbi:MAG TPA: hypothetical protein PKD32_12890 [Saprospiraceae bacterium]|nr:hypothetical protein [Saprospiraceae bacterium]